MCADADRAKRKKCVNETEEREKHDIAKSIDHQPYHNIISKANNKINFLPMLNQNRNALKIIKWICIFLLFFASLQHKNK